MSSSQQSKTRRSPYLSKYCILLFAVALFQAVGPAAAGNYYNYADDAAAADDAVATSGGSDDDFIDLSYEDFDQVSLMPVSCVNYMNGHMIKFEMFESTNNFQCHTNNLGTFVVSISHYMRAYFNYQALILGQDFKLPSDAGYLNCVLLQQTAYSDVKLYAKIGCLERDTYTSTKLRVHVYTDNQCSTAYDDGQSESRNNRKGYDINGYYFSSKVSFRPPFYSCMTCKPSEISSSFSKRKTFWYDDDAASNGYQIYKYFDDWLDDYFQQDDAYFKVQQYTNNERTNEKVDDDDFYTVDDDDSRRSLAIEPAEMNAMELYEKGFWKEHEEIRELGNGNNGSYNDDNTKYWNMCTKVYKYGVWCDEDCRALDAFRIDEWSKSDVFLLVVMSVFMGFMMLLVFAKRVKAYEKASIYGDEMLAEVGMSPAVMVGLFAIIFILVIVLAVLKFVNETLVFAVVSCILLFIYMLKITLFESKSPPLLGSKRGKKKNTYRYGDDYQGYDGDNPLFKY